MEDPRLDTLRKRLIQMGDLEEGAHSGDVYDGALIDGVKKFQYRHGIDQDGVIGPATLAEFNTDIDKRIEQLELNMERRRWMPPTFGDFYVFINLADQFPEGGEGQEDHPHRTAGGRQTLSPHTGLLGDYEIHRLQSLLEGALLHRDQGVPAQAEA